MTTGTEITPMEAMRGTLVKMQPEFAAALPPQIPVEKFIRTTLTAVQMTQSFWALIAAACLARA